MQNDSTPADATTIEIQSQPVKKKHGVYGYKFRRHQPLPNHFLDADLLHCLKMNHRMHNAVEKALLTVDEAPPEHTRYPLTYGLLIKLRSANFRLVRQCRMPLPDGDDYLPRFASLLTHFTAPSDQDKLPPISEEWTFERLYYIAAELSQKNSRLKADASEYLRKLELLAEEAAAKDESNRHLQWRLEDERSAKQQADDSVHRKAQQAVLELDALRESSGKELSELQSRLDKVSN